MGGYAYFLGALTATICRGQSAVLDEGAVPRGGLGGKPEMGVQQPDSRLVQGPGRLLKRRGLPLGSSQSFEDSKQGRDGV